MCGIVGCVGLKQSRRFVIEGLQTLDYRGYDSAGVAFGNDDIKIFKEQGSVDFLNSTIPPSTEGRVAIGHTRWATHGKPNKNNSHPHLSSGKQFAIVHNGVIDNYLELRSRLLEDGVSFSTDTDTEVIVNLIEFHFKKTNDVLKAIAATMRDIEGSYAVGLVHLGEDRIYVMKNASPLLIGVGPDFHLLASDASPMIEYTNLFVELDDKEYGYIEKDGYRVFDFDGKPVEKQRVTKEAELLRHTLNGYDHYMMKEIEEIEPVIRRMTNYYCLEEGFSFDPELIAKLRQSDHIIFLGCGTSYHASLIGGRYFEEMGIPTASYIASEWAFHPMFPGKKPFVILISQSGETADLIHCLKEVKERGFETLIITNTKGSTLERACTYSLLLHAGVEVSVASTKAYVAQVVALLFLVAAVFDLEYVKKDLDKACHIIAHIRKRYKGKAKEIAEAIKDEGDIFYLGRGYDYYMSLEASLKLKEISYIHSEAIAGGELKHGPIALIEEGTPVVVFVTDKLTAASMRGNIKEVESRGAKVYVISTSELSKTGDAIVVEDYPSYLSSIIISSIAFYLAYYVACLKGYNVDKPRNLAKSVTVE